MAPSYLDFELEIGIGQGRDYPVAVLRSPAGEAQTTMRFPFGELQLESHLKDLQIALLRSGGQRRSVLTQEEQAVQDFGCALFDALISGEVRSLYDVSKTKAVQAAQGLRLKLRVASPQLAALPWEFLYDTRRAEYVCLSVHTPVVRYMELPQPPGPLAVTPPLRILGMIASPSDFAVLDVENEKTRVEQALTELRSNGLVELEWLSGQTWRDLQRAMRHGPWHIFHFVGHGAFDANADEGLIMLADEQGKARPLRSKELGRLLADHRDLRLAVLNACEGAKGGNRDLFSSTASILVRQGLPAVMAMQYDITDRAAVELSQAFYESVAEGLPVDAALAEARKAVSLAVTNTMEWGTPVLYMRAPDGRIFDMPAPVGPLVPPDQIQSLAETKLKPSAPRRKPASKLKPSRSEPPPRLAPLPDLDERYSQALEHFQRERWSEASAIFGEIVVQQPDHLDAAAKLEQARHQQTLAARYAEAGKAYEAAQWAAAIEDLEVVVALDPSYEDAAARLTEAKRQQTLVGLYDEARRLSDAKAWQTVVKVFERIHDQDPGYPDPGRLLAIARETLAEQERECRLAELYEQAMWAMDIGQLHDARLGFEQVAQLSPGYKKTETLLARVRSAIGQREAETQRQAHLTELSQRATDLMAKRNWDEAAQVLVELRKVGANEAYVAARLAEIGRQRDLEALYRQGLAHFQAQQWPEAAAAFEKIVRGDPTYGPPEHEQAKVLLAQARQAKHDADRRTQELQHAHLLAGLYRQAEERLTARDWQRAVELLTQIWEADPNAPGVAGKLAAARHQRDLAEQFATAQSRLKAGRWQDAITVLQALVNAEPDYTDPAWGKASTLLRQIRDEQERRVRSEVSKPAENAPQNAPQKVPEKMKPAILAQPSQAEPVDMLTTTEPIRLELVRVRAGEFLMGTQPEDMQRLVRDYGSTPEEYKDETPQQRLFLPDFYIGRYPVTVEQFDAFVKATSYQTDAERDGDGWVWTGKEWKKESGASWRHPSGPKSAVKSKGDHPVTQVSWNDAQAFCKWAKVRLPTEAEWEKAARGVDGRAYPWGNQVPGEKLCNFALKVGDTSPVGAYPCGISPYGALDLAGNVWEYCSSQYKNYPYRADDGRENLKWRSFLHKRVLRGGSFGDVALCVRCAVRNFHPPGYRLHDSGFRVCWASPSASSL